MTSMPASRSARAMILAPRSWPSRPGLATTTRILRFDEASMRAVILRGSACERAHEAVDRHEPDEPAGLVVADDRVEAILVRAVHGLARDHGGRLARLDAQQAAL